MEHESCSYPEALRYLAKKYNIDLEEDTAPNDEYREKMQLADSLFIINKAAQNYYSEQLFSNKYAKDVALTYFKERGLREDLIKKFDLGFANGENADLVKHLQNQHFDNAVMEQAGLVNQYGKDFFRQRVLFPIHNIAGKVVGFGGRTMSSDKTIPKYINTRETEIYIKNKTLYGLHIAKKTIQQKNEAWLTEGYMDVLSLHQAGFSQTVASAGTSLTAGQVSQIKKYCENVTILYDGDPAGIAAAEKAINLFLEQDMNPQVLLFPSPEDPDSYVRKVGSAAFEQFVKQQKQDFVSFKIEISADFDKNNPLSKIKVLGEVIKLLSKIREPLKRSVFIKKTSDLFEIAEEKINQEVNKIISRELQKAADNTQENISDNNQNTNTENGKNTENSNLSKPSENSLINQYATGYTTTQNENKPNTTSSQEYHERDIIRLLIQFGHLHFSETQTVAEFILENILDLIDQFDTELYSKIILEYMETIDNQQDIKSDYFINHQNSAIAALAVDLLAPASQYEYSHNWAKWNVFLQSQQMPDQNHQKDSFYAVSRFKLKKIEKLCAKNTTELKKLQNLPQSAEFYTNAIILIKVQMKLIALKTEYANKTNTVVLK
jgi:DNA primase